ncbi:type II secretion system protein [Aneurinibacillus sp. Ricciae_BoGa-3]|uniref:pilus assembly FimT family protein n=1 Tax=Aneurinibacillus sp. Ricciae_BoGa-3 TaxID=3022697 RepID=UPI002341DBE1|nr:type II secretion system protein [Aneurinibacillus sp. Ricciae_BoGa-3]WCK53650.1 type II secretion system protein [Aneurinibacillus sp. Ricciae_BoGa-3]
MFKRFMKRYLKNERGLTLIELLATIVILGIISAIAVPAIGGLIDNSKKDATVANAQQMVNSTKLLLASGAGTLKTGFVTGATSDQQIGDIINKGGTIYLSDLYDQKQLEMMKDPFNSNKDYDSTAGTGGSYVKFIPAPADGSKGPEYDVYLKGGTDNPVEYIAGASSAPLDITTVTRSTITKTKTN